MNKICACETPTPKERPSGAIICQNLSCGLPIVTYTLTRQERP